MLKKLGRLTKINQVNGQSDEGRDVPPGQFVTDKFPVLSYGPKPKIELNEWRFRVFGLVDGEVTLDWKQFKDLTQTTLDAEFHCVTQWSNLHNTWGGVLFNDVLKLVQPRPEARFVMLHCYGGYTTNLPLEIVTDNDVLFARSHDGKALEPEHGAPLRFIVPKRYAWKSAKWVNGLEFMAEDRPGFWEVRGYHNDGDPWKEQRFWDSLT